ncbi:hypothetical protein [Pseudomonas sp. MPC6]|uniref:hypothetical protein n=1 Tax=unclassified Pseudomonas TaxID=196821 RepID=UPI001110AE81|nr:hypothetical protein [Pseudomonas sp. MPC6]QCY11122.1 hypothetical protein ELQ88_10010 [Pseudomonas sp. MPC6]
MSDLNEDLSESMAAVLTDSVGLHDDGSGDMSDSLAADLHDQETMLAERDIPVSNDVQDTREAAEQRDVEQEQAQQSKRKVPLAALHEERTKRQQAEQATAQLQAQLQQLMQQQQAAQQQAQQAAAEAEIPDVEEDPVGWLKAKEKQFEQRLEQLQNGPAQQQQAAVQHQQVALAVDSLEKQFAASVPDYEQAVELVQRNADAQIRQLYPQATEEQLQMVRTGALNEFARQCLASGTNPAERIYAKAQALGHRSAPRVQPNTSLSTLSGSARAPDERGAISASQISEMSDAEFDKFWKEMKGGGSQGPAF